MGEKLVVDTNILISAIGWRGKPHTLFQKIVDGNFELLISAKQLEELIKVMSYPRLNFTEDQKSRFLSILMEVADMIEITEKIEVIKDDPSDNMHLECAISGNA